MATMPRAPRRAPPVKQRRLRKYRARLEHEPRRAPRFLQALEPALVDLRRPEPLVAEGEWRLPAQVKRRGTSFGLMCPTVLGCRTVAALTQVRGWDTHAPGRLLGAGPKQTWSRPWQRRGQALLSRRWQQGADTSPAPQRRWPWPWAADDSGFKQSGQQLGLVGTGSRGQDHRGRLGLDGLLLGVVRGDGQRVVPVACVVRRPDPVGPGRPGRDTLTWLQVLLERRGASRQRRCRGLPPPVGVADSWWGEAAWLEQVHTHQPGACVVAGTRRYGCALPAGRRVTGADLRRQADWPGRNRPPVRGRR
jgi:hypothetical protein